LLIGGLAGSLVIGPRLRGQTSTLTEIPKEFTSYRGIVKKVLPAVVSIQGHARTTQSGDRNGQPKRRSRSGDQQQLPEELRRQLPEEFRRFFEGADGFQFQVPDEAVPQVGFGSGFLVDPKGVILTNNHVVAGADQVEVQLQDGRKFLSKDIHGDQKTDLAIVRLDTKDPLPYLELGDSDAMEIGDRVLAVGAPFGLVGTVTAGIVSAKDRALNINMYEDFLQTDAAINPGNSGGPLINMAGQVIGINAAIKSRTGAFQGVGLAVPSNMAKTILKDLETGGVVHRGYLGVQVEPLNPDVAERFNIQDHKGVVVGRVFDNSPAAKAGIRAGDVITRINGKSVKDTRELQHSVLGLPLHKAADLGIVRDGKPMDVPVTIEEQPQDYGLRGAARPQITRNDKEGVSVDKYGMELQDLTSEAADQYGLKEGTKGAVITRVERNSAAYDQGLRPGMVITRVEKRPVASAEAARAALEKASSQDGVMVQILDSQGVTAYRILKPETAK
jgi:serine protease Do